MFLLVLSIVVVLFASFFCSLSEAAVLSLDRMKSEALAEQSAAGRLVRQLKRRPEATIVAILILNTVSNTGGAAVAGSAWADVFSDDSMLWFSGGLTVAVLMFSEILPKSLGVMYAERSALLVARPLVVLVAVAAPMTWLVGRIQELLGPGGNQDGAVSREDLRLMARLAAAHRIVGQEERRIIEAAADLPKVAIRDIMIDRRDVQVLSLAEDQETNLVRARRSLHTRMPVCRNDLDDVLGIVNMKELLWRLAETPRDLEEEGLPRILGEEMRPPLFARAEDDVSDLIALFATKRAHVALVRDDAEQVVGMVTLEDAMEELTGEIDDELDRRPRELEALPDGTWRIGGGVDWREVEEALAFTEPLEMHADLDGRLDVNDVAAERTPRNQARTGSRFEVGDWVFEVSRVRRGKVLTVMARRR